MQPLWKLIFLLFTAPIADCAITSPNPTPPAKEILDHPKLISLLKPGILLQRSILWSWALADFAVTFSASTMCPPTLAQCITQLLVHSREPDQAIARVSTLSPSFCIGACLVILGGLLRMHCYHVLGRFFTFELSIRKDHRLVTTGPYAVVRHPSYTGALINLLGMTVCLLHESSWLVACSGWFPHDEQALNCLQWGLRASMMLLGLLFVQFRINSEDAMLKKTFGKDWEDWARKVPYRMFPRMY